MDDSIRHLDDLLRDGRFDECDLLLSEADFSRLPSAVRRAFLAVTRPAKKRLFERTAAYQRALRQLAAERGLEAAQKMLKTLA